MTYYTKDHEWLDVDGDVATVGITQHAADALGDIVFVDVGSIDTVVTAGAAAAVVESVKAASDIYAPVSGTIIAANPLVAEQPDVINHDPEGKGWIYKIRLADAVELAGLMQRAAYDAFVANG